MIALALGLALPVTRAGACSVHSIYSPSFDSRFSGRLSRVGRFSAELFCVLRRQSLPAAELHRIRAGDAPDGHTAEKAIQNIESNVPARGAPRDEAAVDLVPQRQSGSGAGGCEFP